MFHIVMGFMNLRHVQSSFTHMGVLIINPIGRVKSYLATVNCFMNMSTGLQETLAVKVS